MYRLLIPFIFFGSNAFAQVTVSPHSKLFFQKSAFGFVSELLPAAPKTLGSSYYSEEWLLADIFLKGETKLEGAKVKLDLLSQNLDIFYDGAVKILPGDKVLSFQWIAHSGDQEVFVRGNYTTTDGLKISGFLKLMTDTEPFKLVEFYTTETISANYNAQLDVGNKDHQIVQKTRVFVVKEKLLLEVKGSKKKFINDFKDAFQTDVSAIVKEFDIDPRDQDELIVLLRQLNYTSPG